MKRLYTVTANLLAETTCTYQDARWGATHRAVEESFQVGGKGVNVARMAQRIGVETVGLCFPGGDTGARCLRWLAGQPFQVRAFPQQAETRAGWVIRNGAGETTFLAPDRPLELPPWRQALAFLAAELRPGDSLAICGSIPGWRAEVAGPLVELIERFAGTVFIAVDTYGAPLEDLVHLPLDLVKINRQEIEPLLGRGEERSPKEFLRLETAKRVKNRVVTDGGRPLLARGADGPILQVTPPEVEVVSPVGCGDVLLAGLVKGLSLDRLGLAEAVPAAVALAAANARSAGIADFPLDDLPSVGEVTRLSG